MYFNSYRIPVLVGEVNTRESKCRGGKVAEWKEAVAYMQWTVQTLVNNYKFISQKCCHLVPYNSTHLLEFHKPL